jgi:ABC-type phosphate transport system auxiliary subunit
LAGIARRLAALSTQENAMSNGDLHAREREDLALHVERCAERYGAVQNELSSLRQQVRRIETAIWGMGALLLALGAGGAQVLGVLRALAQVATP